MLKLNKTNTPKYIHVHINIQILFQINFYHWKS